MGMYQLCRLENCKNLLTIKGKMIKWRYIL